MSKQLEYPFLAGSLSQLIEVQSHKVETDPVALTELAEVLAEQEGSSIEYVAYVALYNAGLISKEGSDE